MDLFPFLDGNVAALQDTGSLVLPWLARHPDALTLARRGLGRNGHGVIDWALEGDASLFAAAPPEVFYRGWEAGERPEASASIVVGINLGYGLNHVLNITPDSHKVVVIEPRPEMLTAALGLSDYRPFIQARKLHILPPDELLLGRMVQGLDLQFLFGSILLREDLPSRQLGPEYARWSSLCRARLENFAVEISTLRRKQDVMVSNELRNFDRAVGDGSLVRLKDAAQGQTAVVLGAGPSLARFAPRLAQAPGQALYATALQTLPALQEHGLVPHFCLAIDYSEGMRHIFARLDPAFAARVPLVYSTKIDPEVLCRYPGPTLPLWTQGGLSTYVLGGNELVLDAGGNVGVTLLRFLAWAGARRMVLVGQDFGCAVDGPTHAGGHHAHQQTPATSPAFSVRLTAADGREIASSPQMMAAKRDMEADIAANGLEVWNLYGGGAPIVGAKDIDLAELDNLGLLTAPTAPAAIFVQALGQARQPAPRPVFESRQGLWSASLRQAEKRLDKLFRKCERNQAEIHRTLSQLEFFLRQDPLYSPYLFNEITDMAGLARTRVRYSQPDAAMAKGVLRRALAKVKEMDRILAPAQAA